MKLKENRKLQIVFCVLSMVVVVGIYFFLNTKIEQNMARKRVLAKAATVDNNVLVDIAETSVTGENLNISGWIVHMNAELLGVKVVLFPLNQKDEQAQVLTTSLNSNRDLKKYIEYLDVEETRGSGFTVSLDKKKLLQNVCYEIQMYAIYMRDEEQVVKVSTQQYLYNGQVYSYNPLEFVAPEFADEYMAKVVEEGCLLGYTMEHGAWVYQYGDDLYWILDKSVAMNLDENLYMFFHLNTSHRELLPETRQQYGFDNKDFLFKKNEVETDGNYRVAKVELDMEYPVSYVKTGQYDTAQQKNYWSIRNKLHQE